MFYKSQLKKCTIQKRVKLGLLLCILMVSFISLSLSHSPLHVSINFLLILKENFSTFLSVVLGSTEYVINPFSVILVSMFVLRFACAVAPICSGLYGALMRRPGGRTPFLMR